MTRPIPYGYTGLEYLQTASAGPYIDTGIAVSSLKNKYVRITIRFTKPNNTDRDICGTANNSTNTIILNDDDTGFCPRWGNTNHIRDVLTYYPDKSMADFITYRSGVHTLQVSGPATYPVFSVDGVDIAYYNNTGASFDNTQTIRVFGGRTASACSIYSFTIESSSDSGSTWTMLSDLVPVRNDHGVCGMYDYVSKTFLTNIGTGVFVAGPVVSSDYREVEYIESDGQQWMSTGYVHPSDWYSGYKHICLEANDTTQYTNLSYLATLNSSNYLAKCIAMNGSGFTNMGYENPTAIGTRTTKSSLELRVEYDEGYLYVDGVRGSYGDYSEMSTPNPTGCTLYLGIVNTPANSPSARYYSLRIVDTDGTTVLYDYVPAIRVSDEVAGMYDTVNDVFIHSESGVEYIAPHETPFEYTRLEYIQTSGTQYILTGVQCNASESITVDTTLQDTQASSGGSTVMIGFGTQSGAWAGAYGTVYACGGGINSSVARTTKTVVTVNWRSGVERFTVGGTYVGQRNYTGLATDYVKIGSYSPQYPCSIKIYEVSITVDNVEVLHLVPARLTDNTICMVDTLMNEPYLNAGTGVFIAGPVYREPSIKVNVSGEWKDVGPVYVKVDGEWKFVEKVFVKVNGTWKKTYEGSA